MNSENIFGLWTKKSDKIWVSKRLVNLSQEEIAPGKKPFMYLGDLPLLSRKLLLTFALYKKGL